MIGKRCMGGGLMCCIFRLIRAILTLGHVYFRISALKMTPNDLHMDVESSLYIDGRRQGFKGWLQDQDVRMRP